MKKVLGLLVAVVLLSAGRLHAAEVFAIDPAHSSIGFSVKHLMVSQTKGDFDTFTGSIKYDAANSAAFEAIVNVEAKSINTKNAQRDEHLRGADFLDVAKFPAITFKSKSFDGKTLVGDLTLHGITKSISVPVTLEGPVKNPMGPGNVLGLSGSVTINRQDYGVVWNKALDNGGVAVSNDVVVEVKLEAHSS